MTTCELCGREAERTSKHHLLPKQKGGRHTATVDLCQPCHSTIHRTFTNAELARHYTTVEALQQAEKMLIYLEWIRKRKIERI